MPAQHYSRKRGLKVTVPRKPPLPQPGVGGYNYPRGPYGATGFPGSTPASKRTHTQGPDGRDDTSYLGNPKNTISELQDQWNELPPRDRRRLTASYMGGAPGVNDDAAAHRPKWPGDPVPSLPEVVTGRQVWQPARRKALTTGPEHRSTPVIGGAPGSQNVRNQIAQRYKADPARWRAYRASPNPGKTGARLDGPARYHPGTTVHGHPDGKPVPGMAPQPGYGPMVVVQSRFVSAEGSQEGYAMDRELRFTKGGTPAPQAPGMAPHIRGGRYSGQRYVGDLADQQQIGLDSDSYGIARRRGPRHRPVRFETPAPHTANFYDVPPDQGTQAPDMIHRSPATSRTGHPVAKGTSPRRQPARTVTPSTPESRSAPGRRPRRG